jgi:hypothetical protein
VPTADTKHSLVVFKRFDYRGLTREFTNRYHFEGDLPDSDAHWTTLCDNIVTSEKAIYTSGVSIVQVIGYDASTATSTNPHGDAVFSKTYATAGTFAPGTDGGNTPGDCAALVRYDTPARSARNHPVYLMNYYHGVRRSTDDADLVASLQKTAYETYADHWISGFTDGAIVRERCGPRGAVAIGRRVDPVIRHRDFPA